MKSEKKQQSPTHRLAWNRDRRPYIIPGGDEGDMVRIEPGFNRVSIANWDVARSSEMVDKAIKNDDIRVLDRMEDLHNDVIDQVLKGCASMTSVKWWASVERRAGVKAKVDAWVEKMEAKFARARDGRRTIKVT